MEYNYALKIISENKVALNRFPIGIDLPSDYTLITKSKYDGILKKINDNPDGSFKNNTWLPKTKAQKDKEAKDLEDKKKFKEEELFAKEDDLWIERYNRFKADGSID